MKQKLSNVSTLFPENYVKIAFSGCDNSRLIIVPACMVRKLVLPYIYSACTIISERQSRLQEKSMELEKSSGVLVVHKGYLVEKNKYQIEQYILAHLWYVNNCKYAIYCTLVLFYSIYYLQYIIYALNFDICEH